MKTTATLLKECREKLDAVRSDILAMVDGNEAVSTDLLNRALLEFHSLKDTASLLRCYPLKHLSHLSESVLTKVRDGDLVLSSACGEALLLALDRMSQMVAGRETNPNVQFREELNALTALLGRNSKPAPAEVKDDVEVESADAPADLPRFRHLRVLVVEDDFVSRTVLQGLLSKYGECHLAVTGSEAVEAFNSARQAGRAYDLICLDVNMPEMDGSQALARIRAIETSDGVSLSRARIFMTTSVRDAETVAGSLKLMCDAYLLKPIDGAKLLERLLSLGLIRRERWLSPP